MAPDTATDPENRRIAIDHPTSIPTNGGYEQAHERVHTVLHERGGWPDDDIVDGDRIRWPPALSSDPRGVEHLSRSADAVEPQHLVVFERDGGPFQPCTFCSPPVLVEERGILDSDYRLETEGRTLVAYTCSACISEAPDPDEVET
jgi:hypothetical protein